MEKCKLFKNNKTLCLKSVLNYIVYVILFGILIGAIFIMVCGGASAIVSFKSKFIEVKIAYKIAYIIVYGIIIFIPYIILRLLYKYWRNKPKIEKETFYRCISCVLLTIFSVLSMVNGVLNSYRSTLDLMKGSTEQVAITNVYTEKNSSSRSGTTYRLKGVDKNGKSYSFSIDRKDYNSLKSSNGRNLKITYYHNSQVIEKIDL